jgi:Protein of unknown function (DUF3016)
MSQQPFALALAAAAGLAFAAALAPATAAGVVEVSYVEPAQFSDVGHTSFDRDSALKSITEFLQSLGPRLSDGAALRLQVTDIDLAGDLVPLSERDVRVLRGGADWPRIALHYTLLEKDKVVASGDADLSDMDYFAGLPSNARRRGDLPYEKAMLLRWFDTTIAAP